MDALCKYYSSNVRLVAGMNNFISETNFNFYCLNGSVVNNKGNMRVTTEYATVLVNFISSESKRNLIAVLTSDPAYEKYNGGKIDTDIIKPSDTKLVLCHLLREKFVHTGNYFRVEFSADGKILAVSPEYSKEGEFQYRLVVKTPTGDILLRGEESLIKMLGSCKALRGFTHSTSSPELEKDISVRKNRGEILREIAHYLNRTVVLVSFIRDGKLLEQYVSTQGILEIMTRKDYTKVYKRIPSASLRYTNPFCIYLTSSSVDEIAKEQGRLLKKN